MLAQSIDEILGALKRYGLRRESAIYSANEIIHNHDVGEVVKELVNFSGAWEKEPDNPTGDKSKYGPARKWRISLGQHARSLKKKQEIVHDRRKAVADHVKKAGQGDTYIVDEPGYERDRARLKEADDQLAAAWAISERGHPVLAAFRGGFRRTSLTSTSARSTTTSTTPIRR